MATSRRCLLKRLSVSAKGNQFEYEIAMVADNEGPFRNRVSEEQVAQVLRLIATLPNKRERPIAGDLPGTFDFWFDGGAGRIVTGWNEYDLTNGTRITVGSTPALSVAIEFPNG